MKIVKGNIKIILITVIAIIFVFCSKIYAAVEIQWECVDTACKEIYFINWTKPSVFTQAYYYQTTPDRDFKYFKSFPTDNSGKKIDHDNYLNSGVSNFTSTNITTISASTFKSSASDYEGGKVATKANDSLKRPYITALSKKYNAPSASDGIINNYATKIAYKDGGEYKDFGNDLLEKFKILDVGMSDKGANDNVVSPYTMKNYNLIDSALKTKLEGLGLNAKTNTNEIEYKDEGPTRSVSFYISKVYLTNANNLNTNKNKYDFNYDKPGQLSAIADSAFYSKLTLKITSYECEIIYKYKDTGSTTTYTEDTSKRKILNIDLTNSRVTVSTKDDIEKGIKTNYNYVGYKVVSDNLKSIDDLRKTVDSATVSKGYGDIEKENFNISIDKKKTVICLYYDTRPVEVTHILLDKNEKEVAKLNKDKKAVSGSNNIDYLDYDDVKYNYLGKEYKHTDGKVYKYVNCQRGRVNTYKDLDAIAALQFVTSTPITPELLYSKGSFVSSKSVVIRFYYKEATDTSDRNVYIKHIDENGNLLGANESETINGKYIKNATDYASYLLNGKEGTLSIPNAYSEYFKLPKGAGMKIYSLTSTSCTYVGYKIGTGVTRAVAESEAKNSTTRALTSVSIATTAEDLNTVIEFIYKCGGTCTGSGCGEQQVINDIKFVGRLSFINNPSDPNSNAYSTSTASETLDYIASGKSLKGYISGAYPYYLRRVDYEKKVEEGSRSANVTINIAGSITGKTHGSCTVNGGLDSKTHQNPYLTGWSQTSRSSVEGTYDNWPSDSTTYGAGGSSYASTKTEITYEYVEYNSVTKKYKLNKVTTSYSRSVSSWYDTCSPYLANPTDFRTISYTVPYSHTYYHITNFKMYRISKVELYDKSSQKGDLLFGESDQTFALKTSSSYENRFSGGLMDKNTTIVFDSKSYSIESITGRTCGEVTGDTVTGGDCGSLTTTLKNDMKTKLNAVTDSAAAESVNLTFKISGYNENFQLTGKSKMLNDNNQEKTLSVRSKTNTKQEIDTTIDKYTTNVTSYQDVNNAITNASDFENSPVLTIPISKVNGIRILSARIFYEIDTRHNRSEGTRTLNYGVDSYGEQYHDYKDNDVNKVNVLTPLNLSIEITTDQVVNHSDKQDVITLQKNSTFTIRPRLNQANVASYNNVDTNEFCKYYYIKCDFDITDLKVHGTKESSDGYRDFSPTEIIRGGTWIKVPIGGYITGKATQFTETQGTTVNIQSNNIEAIAVAKNMPALLENFIYDTLDSSASSSLAFANYYDNVQTLQYTGDASRHGSYSSIRSITSDAYHMVRATKATSNLGRIFDFKLTDCTDLNFKDVFRTSTGSNVNKPTGTVYFSGFRRLKIYTANSNIGYNDTESVPDQKTTLPLGPYKNTNIAKIDAPKLGYRFSFDLKTTGYISDAQIRNGTRRIVIKPSYYFISKDGKTFDDNITLYYKSASGKYIPFLNSTTPYKLYFRPNDGYRNLSNKSITPNSTFLSDKLEELEISSPSGFTLNYKMMDTSGNGDNFIQSWYGEFKLPNSTIAVPNGGNVNNPRTDGYIGVRFDIVCIDTINNQTITLSYNQNDKSASPNTNTSQWDYEAYLGFTTPGQEANNLKLRLEKDTITLTNELYNKIKGTVVLYDADSRAAQDFE